MTRQPREIAPRMPAWAAARTPSASMTAGTAPARLALGLALALVLGLGLAVAAPAHAASVNAPHISWVRCYLPRSACGADPRLVAPGGSIKIAGRNLRNGMIVAFTRRPGTARVTARARLIARNRLKAFVPAAAGSGRIRLRFGRLSSNLGGPIVVGRVNQIKRSDPTGTAFDSHGMWVWYVSRAAGGDPDALAAQARSHGVGTVFVKSGDGSQPWAQFSPSLVQALKARGLRVCAWQYVYGTYPAAEARIGATSAARGADCLVIDAEGEYEGRYAQAATYISQLRQAVGPAYPVGLAGFPYVHYHPAYPYSVFLGPGGAQFNLPQMYWRAIGTSVDAVFQQTYRYNTLYGRPIYPLGQLYQDPAPADVARFRALAAAYGAPAVSWWDWQHATGRGWAALTAATVGVAAPPVTYPVLGRGAKGDVVVWLQQHLVATGRSIAIDGIFSDATASALADFQASTGLPASGRADQATWERLLAYAPAPAPWASGAWVAAAVRAHARTGPASRRLPAVRNELAGRPKPPRAQPRG